MPDSHLDVALAEVLANVIYACDSEPPLNARTVPHRWAIYQKQARSIAWPKILPALLAAGWTPPTPVQGEDRCPNPHCRSNRPELRHAFCTQSWHGGKWAQP